jgi:Ca-activated chloride channel family protein
LQAKGVILKPFIIGIGIDEAFRSTFECVGNYYDAGKEETFKNVLDIVITQALNSTTVQINLLSESGKPTETNIPISIENDETGALIHDFVHTLNHKGNPDTLTLDPLFTYRVTAHTYPPVSVGDLKMTPGEHNIMALETPQGDLNLAFDHGRNEYPDLKCLVTESESCDIVNIQNYGSKESYITGAYNLEIQTLPPMFIEDVVISQSHTTDIKIPLPGILLLQTGASGYGGVFKIEGDKKTLVKRFTYGESSGRYIMQPGDYSVVFRSKSSKQTVYTMNKTFSISSGRNTSVSL